MASGENEGAGRCYTYICPRRPAPAAGKVLDLESYRRRLAPQGPAWEAEAPEVGPAADLAAAIPAAQPRLGLMLDLFATVAIAVMSIVVVSRFLMF